MSGFEIKAFLQENTKKEIARLDIMPVPELGNEQVSTSGDNFKNGNSDFELPQDRLFENTTAEGELDGEGNVQAVDTERHSPSPLRYDSGITISGLTSERLLGRPDS